MNISLTINGVKKSFEISPDEYLLETLRKHNYLSVKQGCDTGACGVCTVHVNDKAVLSCTMLSARADGAKVTTIDGLSDAKVIGSYLVDEGADQCGYCSAGTIMSISYLESQLDGRMPTDQEILHYLSGNLCRCTGYEGQLRAIKKYLEVKHNETC